VHINNYRGVSVRSTRSIAEFCFRRNEDATRLHRSRRLKRESRSKRFWQRAATLLEPSNQSRGLASFAGLRNG
jgi:hypothetical protein